MSHINILEEKPLTLIEVSEELGKVKKRDETLSPRSLKVEEYAHKFKVGELVVVQDLRQKLQALDILRLKEKHIVKLLDLMPEDLESLKIIFAGEDLTLKQEDLQKVLECLR